MLATLREIRTIFTEEFRRTIRRRIYRILTLAVPVILLVLLVAVPVIRGIAGDDEDRDKDQDQIGILELSGELAVDPGTVPGFQIYQDRESGIAALLADEIEGFFVIPEDYLATGKVEWLDTGVGIAGGSNGRGRVREFLRAALVADDLAPELVTRMLDPADFDRIKVNEDGSTDKDPDKVGRILVPLLFGGLLMFGIMLGGSFLMESVSEEKETRMIEILLTSVSPLAVMVGKVLALGAAGLIQLAVWVASVAIIGPHIFDQIPGAGQLAIEPGILALVIAFSLTGYLVFAVTMAGIGAATASTKEASQISMIVTLPSFVPVMFIGVLLENPDGGVSRLLSFIPFTAPVTMMIRLAASDVPLWEVVASLAVLLLTGVALLWISARVFRAGLLMYGQRMSLRGVIAALRQAG